MNEYIKVLNKSSDEYMRLELAARLMSAFSKHGYTYYVGETYFDYGQDWKWTTIICEDRDCQVLSPRDQASIILATSPSHLGAIIEEMWTDKYSIER